LIPPSFVLGFRVCIRRRDTSLIFNGLPALAAVARDSLNECPGAEWMAEAFLEEQLQRIRKLTERMSQVQSRSAELSDEIARDREIAGHNPLNEVRDYRVVSQGISRCAESSERPRHSARDTSSPRRRRR
jgi:hypothetical protein